MGQGADQDDGLDVENGEVEFFEIPDGHFAAAVPPGKLGEFGGAFETDSLETSFLEPFTPPGW
jgi:hypothetical protein